MLPSPKVIRWLTIFLGGCWCESRSRCCWLDCDNGISGDDRARCGGGWGDLVLRWWIWATVITLEKKNKEKHTRLRLRCSQKLFNFPLSILYDANLQPSEQWQWIVCTPSRRRKSTSAPSSSACFLPYNALLSRRKWLYLASWSDGLMIWTQKTKKRNEMKLFFFFFLVVPPRARDMPAVFFFLPPPEGPPPKDPRYVVAIPIDSCNKMA